MQFYADTSREGDKWSLPDAEVFELTARECAEIDEDMVHEYMVHEYMRRKEFRLAGMNSRDREKMFDAMIEEECISGGWFYQFCTPGCLPESSPSGPYKTQQEAIDAARGQCEG